MYFPRVMGYDATTRKHTLLYDADGLEEELELSETPYMVLALGGAIVVVGDQSSGMSSVLESISGVSLPRGTNIVTHCLLELQLRPTG